MYIFPKYKISSSWRRWHCRLSCHVVVIVECSVSSLEYPVISVSAGHCWSLIISSVWTCGMVVLIVKLNLTRLRGAPLDHKWVPRHASSFNNLALDSNVSIAFTKEVLWGFSFTMSSITGDRYYNRFGRALPNNGRLAHSLTQNHVCLGGCMGGIQEELLETITQFGEGIWTITHSWFYQARSDEMLVCRSYKHTFSLGVCLKENGRASSCDLPLLKCLKWWLWS